MRNWSRRAVALVVAAPFILPGTAAAVTPSRPTGPAAAKPYLDSRAAARDKATRAGTTVAAARPSTRTRQARSSLTRSLGREGVLSIDPLTGTPRQLLRTDGALSSPRAGDRADIAIDFVRAHRAALGLDAADLDGLDLQRRVSTPRGLTVVHFRQLYRGIPAFDNDVRVAIDRAGRVHSIAGSPRHALGVASIEPSLSGAEALARLQKNVGVEHSLPVTSGPAGARRTTTFKGGDFARLVLFGTAGGAKLAWHVTYRATSTAFYDAVVDAAGGAVLYRQNLVKAAANADVYLNHPGASPAKTVDLEAYGLPAGATRLNGRFSHQWADIDDDNVADPLEETPRSAGTNFLYPFSPFSGTSCPSSTEPCAWNPAVPTSWQTNRNQNGVQAFYLVSRFHDHLAGPEVGFTDSSGNFEAGGTGGSDPVLTQTDDGAAGTGGPDANHQNNANMSTPPDGQSPVMQMYLFKDSGTAARDFRNINGGDDSGVVWHEYTHGLSNRLVTNADGAGALSTPHSGAMGEAWSDWYASDLQVQDGLKTDSLGTPAEIDVGDYSDFDPHALRRQALDCPVGSVDTRCPGGAATGVGGFTLGDFGKVAGAPEVHADGEIWAETLWDLRQALESKSGSAALASDQAEILVTDGMRLSPPEPTMLDMRNAILAAEQIDFPSGALHDLVWDVFRKRGMGYYAAAADGSDTQPVEDFLPPPDPNGPKGAVTGVVTDSDTGLPISGVRVGFGGHASSPDFDDYLAGETDAGGRYTIANVPTGSYPKLAFFPSAGYNPGVAGNVTISTDTTTTRDIRLTRDWAALNGGAQVRQVSDDTGATACGVDQALDQSQGTTWSAFNPTSTRPDNPHAGPPTVMIELPQTIDISGFLIDPSAGCGDGASATTREYTVETSADGTTFRMAVDGRGAAGFTDDDIDRLNRRNPTGTTGRSVRFVRLRMLSPLREGATCGCSGKDFIDMTEFEVLGGKPNTLPTGSLVVSNANPRAGEPVTFDARSFTDADSAIAGYDWDFDGDNIVDRTTGTATTDFAYATPGSYTAKVAAKDFRGGAGSASTGVTVAPPAAGPPGPPGTPGTPGTPPALGPRPSLTLPRLGTRGAIRPTVRCTVKCTVRAKLVVSRSSARRLGLKKRTLATLSRTLTTTRRTRLRLRVPAKIRTALKRTGVKSIRATLTVTARHVGGRARTSHRVVRIRL